MREHGRARTIVRGQSIFYKELRLISIVLNVVDCPRALHFSGRPGWPGLSEGTGKKTPGDGAGVGQSRAAPRRSSSKNGGARTVQRQEVQERTAYTVAAHCDGTSAAQVKDGAVQSPERGNKKQRRKNKRSGGQGVSSRLCAVRLACCPMAAIES